MVYKILLFICQKSKEQGDERESVEGISLVPQVNTPGWLLSRVPHVKHDLFPVKVAT